MPLQIRQISSTRDKQLFVRLMWDLYAGDTNWVPPLMMDRMKLINEKKNPFYAHADVAWFIAEKNGKPVGRIAAIINHNHNRLHHDAVGFFGFFESINDQSVANALFESAESFLKSKGMTSSRGPANPSVNDEYGLLIEGFSRPPVMLMTYNPSYYATLIEQAGYAKAKDLYAWLLEQQGAHSEKLMRVAKLVGERHSVTVRSLDKQHFDRDVELIKQLYNSAWEENWGFVPFTDAEMDFLASDLKQIYDPELVLFAERAGEVVGFGLSLPDINQAFHAGPRIPSGMMNLPIGLWSLLTKKKAINTVRILVLGVLKEYRGRGIDAMLYWETMERAKRKGYNFGEASWVLEDNDAMNRAAEMMHGERYKTYRIYEKQIG